MTYRLEQTRKRKKLLNIVPKDMSSYDDTLSDRLLQHLLQKVNFSLISCLILTCAAKVTARTFTNLFGIHSSIWTFNNHFSLSSAHHSGSSCHSPESFCLHYPSQIKTASITSCVSCSDRNFQSVLWTSWNIAAYCTIQKSQTTVYSCVKASFQFGNGLWFQCQCSPEMCQL